MGTRQCTPHRPRPPPPAGLVLRRRVLSAGGRQSSAVVWGQSKSWSTLLPFCGVTSELFLFFQLQHPWNELLEGLVSCSLLYSVGHPLFISNVFAPNFVPVIQGVLRPDLSKIWRNPMWNAGWWLQFLLKVARIRQQRQGTWVGHCQGEEVLLGLVKLSYAYTI